jgi:two-component system NarL family sensor kinase
MKFLLLICFSILGFSSQSQNLKSLKRKAQLASDQAWSLRDINPDSSFYYAIQALKYAKASKEKKIEAYSLSDIGNYYKRKEYYKQAQRYYKASLKIRHQLKNVEDIASGYNQLGLLYKQQEKYDSAAYYFREGLSRLPSKEYEGLRLKFFDGLGLTLYHLGQSKKALYYLDNSLNLAEKIKDSLALAKCYQNKGILHEYLGYSSLALDYFTKAERIYHLQSNTNGEIDIQINKASVYLLQGRTELAQKLLLDAEHKSLGIGFNDNLSTIYLDLGQIYANENPSLAYNYFRKAHEYSTTLDKINVRIESIFGIITYHLQRKEIRQAEFWIMKLDVLIKAQNPYYYQQYYDFLSQVYKLQEDYEKAFSFSQKSLAIKDSLDEQTNHAKELLTSLELSRKEKKLLAEQLRRKTNEAIFQKIITGVLVVAVVVLLLLIFYIKKSQRIYREKKIQEQNFEAEIKDLVYESEIKFMESSLALEEDIRTRIGRDLHDHLGNKLAAAQITLDNIEKILIETPEINVLPKLKSAIDLISQACNDVRGISHELVAEELKKNSLNDAIRNLCDMVLPETEMELSFTPVGEPYALSMIVKKNILATVSLLIDNTIRHSKATRISLQIFYHLDSLNLSLDDNGVGFAQNESSNGIGLKNARNRISLIGGIFDITSKKNDGTSITISIPVNND